MIAQYANSYPNREMVFMKLNLNHFTSAKSAYKEMIRKLSELLNCYALRDTKGEMRYMLYFVGRRRLAECLRNTLIAVFNEIELNVKNEYELCRDLSRGYWDTRENPRTIRTLTREKLIKEVTDQLQTLIELKRDFYLDKYARMRKVRENEINDQNFFLEYLRENHLTHLKRFKWR